jgi:acetyl esterase
MPVHPYFESLAVSSLQLAPEAPIADRRAALNKMMMATYVAHSEASPELASCYERMMSVVDGEIALRIYRPKGVGPFPGHLHFHGGAFWMGNLEMDDSWCSWLASDADVVVVSVDYRLAPEHPFPVGLNDCYGALEWTADHARELEITPGELSVGGESAGGNFAAVVALMTRDCSGPALSIQVLNVPVTDLALREPSPLELAYMPDYIELESERANPYVSPVRAPDLSGLPPAHIITAEFDGLREQGEAYAHRLSEAGVPVTLRMYEGMIHGFCKFSAGLAEARQARDEVAAALRIHRT